MKVTEPTPFFLFESFFYKLTTNRRKGGIRSENMATKQSREDFRKKKELEEARKAGTAPAEVDEDGK